MASGLSARSPIQYDSCKASISAPAVRSGFGGGILYLYSRIVLTVAAACIVLGGLYDLFTPQLPLNLARRCVGNEDGRVVIRELLRALGACLVAIGAAVGVLATTMPRQHSANTIALILTLVLPSEGMNAVGMRRVGSPWLVPLLFILLTISGSALALPDV